MSPALKSAAQHEDTVRLNAEHAQAVMLAPEKWSELKDLFKQECSAMTKQSSMTFSCVEPDEVTFQVDKVIRGTHHRAIDFKFHGNVPGVTFKRHFDIRHPVGAIQMTMCGPHLMFSSQGIGVVLDEFVQFSLMPLMGW